MIVLICQFPRHAASGAVGANAAPPRRDPSRDSSRRRPNLSRTGIRRNVDARHRGRRRPLGGQPLPSLRGQGRDPVFLPGPFAGPDARRGRRGAAPARHRTRSDCATSCARTAKRCSTRWKARSRTSPPRRCQSLCAAASSPSAIATNARSGRLVAAGANPEAVNGDVAVAHPRHARRAQLDDHVVPARGRTHGRRPSRTRLPTIWSAGSVHSPHGVARKR